VMDIGAGRLDVQRRRPEDVPRPTNVLTRGCAGCRVLCSQRSRAEGRRVRCHGSSYDTRDQKMYQKNEKKMTGLPRPAGCDRRQVRRGFPRARELSVLGDPPQAERRSQGNLELRHRQGEHAVIDPGLQLRVIEAVAKP